jgi:hypothetical protein
LFFRKKPKIKRSLFRRIVNGFIYFGIGVMIALMILFAISQTSSFREWLREKVVTTINGSINGELSIERIDGTVFTALVLNNTSLVQERDTLLFAEQIEIRVSPLEILFKTIYFRKIALTNANISFLKDKSGTLNISRLTKPSGEEKAVDTTSSGFSYKIQVADLSFNNVYFKLQTDDLKNNNVVYDNLNSDDLRVSNINLSLSAFADIAGKEYRLAINNFSAKPNLKGFELLNLSGDFIIENDKAGVTGLVLETSRSNISISAAAKSLPFLDGGEIQIEKVPLRLDLNANDFNFDDLENFIPSIELLKGSVKTLISARGTLDDLNIRSLDIGVDSTRLKGKGKVKNITGGAEMFIDMVFSDTYIHSTDPNRVMRTIDIPVYEDYGNLKFDTLYFKGEPLKFNAGMMVRTEKGEFDGIVAMDMTEDDMLYDIILNTQNLDLSSFINLHTRLNSHIVLKGAGTSPDSMNTYISLTANWSEIQNKMYQRLNFDVTASNAVVNYDISFSSDTASGKVFGDINFSDLSNPVYNIDAALNNFNLAELIPSTDLETDFNINITATGNNFDPDKLELFAVIGVDSTKISDIELNNKKVIVDLRNNHEGSRIINVVSNLADITLSGQFSIIDIASLIEAETNLITDFIEYNIKKTNPLERDTLYSESQKFNLPEKLVDINYSIEFKDFELLSLLLGNIDMEIDGDINGLIKRNGDSLILSALLDVNYFKYIDADQLYFISGLKLSAEVSNQFSEEFPSSFNSNIDLSVHELFITEKIHNLNLNTNIGYNNIAFSFSGELDDYLEAQFEGDIVLEESSANLFLDSLYIMYNNFSLLNKGKIDIEYLNDQFIFNNFVLTHNPGEIEIAGLFTLNDDQNLSLKFENFPGKDLSKDLLEILPESGFDSNISLAAFWQGTAQSPLINMNLTADSVRIRGRNIGTMITTVDYYNSELNIDINFLDTLYNMNIPKLKIEGSLPVYLSLQRIEQTESGEEVNLTMEANDFDLATITGSIPFVKNIDGILNGAFKVHGITDDLKFSGNLTTNDVSFIAIPNNIKYEAYASIFIDNDDISLENFFLKNTDGTKDGGTIQGRGKIVHENFEFRNIEIFASGQLKILGTETRAVNPNIYGELSVRTRGDLSYIYNDTENSMNAEIIIMNGANITISPTRSAFSGTSDKFIYRYKKYANLLDNDALIDSLIDLSDVKSRHKAMKPSRPDNLNLRVKIDVEDEAKMVFELSSEFKQNLTAYLGGSFEYKVVQGKPDAQGELVLLDDSKLEFIKTFSASGSVRFFNELDNPYLDVTAIYRGYYELVDTSAIDSEPKEVEIRVKLEGPLKELNKNSIQQEENISVYIRENSLAEYRLDATKNSSDAIMFIIVGKFTDGATTQDRDFAASFATSFAGSLVGGFLSSNFGNYVRSVRFEQVGTETRISLIGKAGPIRYEIGGTSQVFQDLTRANVKIEYPPITSLRNLVLRLQRREPLQGTASHSEMITEYGLKYRFNF